MPCEHCCGADKLFDLKTAHKELKRYKQKGAPRTTKKLISLINKINLENKTLLDIGGGIGILQWNHLEKGGKSVTGVDASSGYQEVASAYAKERDWDKKVEYHFGDFIELNPQIENHDFVCMDKVVCCYPHFEQLLHTALDKCNESIALTFPMDGYIAEVFQWLGVVYMKYIEKTSFRPYVHPVKDMQELIVRKGFKLMEKTTAFPWHVQVYNRI